MWLTLSRSFPFRNRKSLQVCVLLLCRRKKWEKMKNGEEGVKRWLPSHHSTIWGGHGGFVNSSSLIIWPQCFRPCGLTPWFVLCPSRLISEGPPPLYPSRPMSNNSSHKNNRMGVEGEKHPFPHSHHSFPLETLESQWEDFTLFQCSVLACDTPRFLQRKWSKSS